MNGDERVVIVHESPTTRTYWLSEDIASCGVDKLEIEIQLREVARDQLKDDVDFLTASEEEQSKAIDTWVALNLASISLKSQLTETHLCTIGQELAKIKDTRIQHASESIHVSINPARTSWSAVNNQIKPIICSIFDTDTYEIEELR